MRFWARSREREKELDREIRDHLELEAEAQQARGMPADRAVDVARRRFGNVGLVKEAVRDAWGWRHWDVIRQDVRYALRGLGRSPAFTATAITSLALGLGANTAVFSLVNALLLRRLPVPEANRLVQVTIGDSGRVRTNFSYAAIHALQSALSGRAALCGFSLGERVEIGIPGSNRDATLTWMTGDCHRALGVPIALGRGLTVADDAPERGSIPVVAVVSHEYWKRELGGADSAVGSTLMIEGTRATIVGVTGPGFHGPNVGRVTDVTLPAAAMPIIRPNGPRLLSPNMNWLRLFGRIEAAMTRPQAAASFTLEWPRVVSSLIAQGGTGLSRSGQLALEDGATGWSDLRSTFTRPLMVLMGIVGLVLLIACANLAGLLLARATARRREFAVRLAMGAGRGRLMRQVLAESLLIALFGAIAAIAIAPFCSRAIVMALSLSRPRPIELDVTLDPTILLFTFTAALGTAVLFSVGPAIRATGGKEDSVLRDAARTRSFRRSRATAGLVVLQTALSVVMVVAAGLFGRTLLNLANADYGFRRDGVTLVSVEIPKSLRDSGQAALAQRVLDDLAALPGVRAASISRVSPSSGSGWTLTVTAAGAAERDKREAEVFSSSADYFRVFDIPFRSGHSFTRTDVLGTPRVVIVSESFATERFPGGAAIGQRVTLGGGTQPLEIVGIVRNIASAGPRRAAVPAIYLPFFQQPDAQLSGGAVIALRTDVPLPPDLIRKRVHERARAATVSVHSFEDVVDGALANERLLAILTACFGAMALILSGVGLYGLLAFTVQTRTAEIGVRTALGATHTAVAWLIMGEGLRLVALGIVIALPGVASAKRLIGGMMFGLSATDPATIAVAVAVICATALVAGYVPAHRAGAIDPMRALKSE